MAKQYVIAPFPSDVDRSAFGHWLTGFTDGEGCFQLGWDKPHNGQRIVKSSFSINLRSDDVSALHVIRSYLACGHVRWRTRDRVGPKRGASKPTCVFAVTRLIHLAGCIVPHFDAFPLRAKKARDYVLWREAILLAWVIHGRPWNGAGQRRWTDAELAHYGELVERLREVRTYNGSSLRRS